MAQKKKIVMLLITFPIQLERSELLQEMGRKLRDEDIAQELVKHNQMSQIVLHLLDMFASESSQSIQFELMTIICSLPK